MRFKGNRRVWTLAAVGLVTISIGSAYAVRSKQRGEHTQAALPVSGSQKTLPPLEFNAQDLMQVQPLALAQRLDISGTVTAVSQATVKSKISGEISRVLVKEGDFVKAGQILAQMDLLEVDARLKEKLAIAASNQAQVDLAQKNLDNNRRLLEKNFVSQVAVDNAISNLAVAKAQLDAAQAQIALARKQMDDATVRAPISGQVAEKTVQPGEKTSIDAKLFLLVDLSKLELEASVPAADIGRVKIGQTTELQIEGIATPQTGKVVRINPATVSGSRSVPIYIALDKPDSKVRSGLFAQGKLTFSAEADLIAIPTEAVREINGQSTVYGISPTNTLIAIPVTLGMRGVTEGSERNWIEVKQGLALGTRIVANNLGPLRVDSPVILAKTTRSNP